MRACAYLTRQIPEVCAEGSEAARSSVYITSRQACIGLSSVPFSTLNIIRVTAFSLVLCSLQFHSVDHPAPCLREFHVPFINSVVTAPRDWYLHAGW